MKNQNCLCFSDIYTNICAHIKTLFQRYMVFITFSVRFRKKLRHYLDKKLLEFSCHLWFLIGIMFVFNPPNVKCLINCQCMKLSQFILSNFICLISIKWKTKIRNCNNRHMSTQNEVCCVLTLNSQITVGENDHRYTLHTIHPSLTKKSVSLAK